MNVFCNCCGMCCRIIPLKKGDNVLIRDGFQTVDEDFLSNLIPLTDEEACEINSAYVDLIRNIFPDAELYRCGNLSDDFKCELSQKPSVCKDFPKSPLAFVPDECSCLGDVFMKNEELKRKIRMIKEEILDYESLIAVGDKDSASYKKIIENLTRFVKKYKDFGSDNW